ncbi:MAG: DUF1553 domain-containing protein [Planctomycetales bacterium]|nr:DUF1553 domain-containing protein [Planctomycetales bacterium]
MSTQSGYGDNAASRSHWAFQAPQTSSIQLSSEPATTETAIDTLILRRLEGQGITASPKADRRILVRRLYYDLLGLPPTYDQVQLFLDDASPDAYEKLIDHLLASEHFGERWARHWLDIARFGDTKGYVFTESRDYPNAYKYRNWVIDAFNRDLPVDQFLKYQLVADQMVEGDDDPNLAAMGYLTLGRRFINNQHDIIDDRIDVVFRGMMGLTVACARCHDHMYDPIATEDYYALYGVFASSPEHQDEHLPLRLKEADQPQDAHVFNRGNPANQGEIARRRFLPFFNDEDSFFEQGSGRKELAEAIASDDNPLTARVFVNRVWSHLMGAPIVSTPSDFGMRTDPPVQRDVLDHLAATFVNEDAWSLKRLIRRIVMSNVYQQSSEHRDDAWAADPENQFYWRANRKRLDFEAMRDSLLACSGHLDATVGGPSVRIETAPSTNRRTLYAFIDRQNLPAIFRTFDFASPDTHSPQRPNTVVPQQALFLLNSPFAQEAAEQLADRIDPTAEIGTQVRELYRLVFARQPSVEELHLGATFATQADEESVSPEHGNPWQFGYGGVDDHGRVTFSPLPYFTGQAWQGGPDRPDPEIGWVILEPEGGHPGNDQKHAAIRRWIAPSEGHIVVRGTLKHPAEEGDGVRSQIVSSRAGPIGEWIAQHSEIATTVESVDVQAGDTVDFLVDCRTNEGHDSFLWPATIEFRSNSHDTSEEIPISSGFHGPLPKPLSGLARYAQTLLLTNEFHFLD